MNEYISHYETLSYDERHIHASHNRAKRSVTKDPHVFLKFKAHGRNFHIRLKRDVSTFSDSLVVSIEREEFYAKVYMKKKMQNIVLFTDR